MGEKVAKRTKSTQFLVIEVGRGKGMTDKSAFDSGKAQGHWMLMHELCFVALPGRTLSKSHHARCPTRRRAEVSGTTEWDKFICDRTLAVTGASSFLELDSYVGHQISGVSAAEQ
jgi:hypothetical protein